MTAAPHLETLLWRVGLKHVAGVDEVGMGPLAGPVIAAAVVMPPGSYVDGVADSKVLTAAARERLAEEIHRRALTVGIGVVEPEEIDRLNIYQAGLCALRRAVEALAVVPEFVLVDGREIPGLAMPQSAYPKGDSFVCSIAAASIVAKVHRDGLMRDLDRLYPGYGFARHMGYSTRAHFAAIREYGPSPIHRRSFAPVRAAGRGVTDTQLPLAPVTGLD
ncbi:MAG: ribonuclease HII [Deltaproteobacteria bacterium]|nr:MAG: ribonuclease HII [Deltaproteobacteria bacterium]TMA77745.1 MAG: ribonuclease HII [Deltaproteobacteria bacterium]TMB15690.1 MAG: ribonuclease HII [Deltaproteobacteria bacterium]